jgi:hypothetical protein
LSDQEPFLPEPALFTLVQALYEFFIEVAAFAPAVDREAIREAAALNPGVTFAPSRFINC